MFTETTTNAKSNDMCCAHKQHPQYGTWKVASCYDTVLENISSWVDDTQDALCIMPQTVSVYMQLKERSQGLNEVVQTRSASREHKDRKYMCEKSTQLSQNEKR